jgi:hypothetical protein
MMTKFESYPFLEIARTYDVDYGDVLALCRSRSRRLDRNEMSARVNSETMDLAEKIGTTLRHTPLSR